MDAEPDVRVDPYLATVVHVVGARQARPNLPDTGCPFCVGGREAPESYDVRWFPNRWPAMPDGRCEVVLYTPDHDATLASLGPVGVRRVIDLWAERTAALAARADVAYVLVFENRGAEVGATIDHPHGQIYAYDHIPSRPARRRAASWQPDAQPADRLVAEAGDWFAVVPYASTFPVAVSLAPRQRVPDVVSLSPASRDHLAALLVDVLGRLDRLYHQPLPYMMWLDQLDWLSVEIVSPWRRAGVARYVAAAEVAAEEYFNPVIPEVFAEQLRALR